VKRVFTEGLFGGIVSFEIKGADIQAVMAFLDRLKMIVPGTSLGDVHTLLLYPVMSSHRDVSPKVRERMGIRENLVRISLGIEAAEDVIADLDQALKSAAS
jgi:cystathionine gamma-synthase